jgi:hypothetical protein
MPNLHNHACGGAIVKPSLWDCANTSQAKGRVERARHTLQDRLVKELRLAGISTIEAANAFLPNFVANYNGRFAKPAARDQDFHRSVDFRQDLDQILC